jgi:hypothetical protein
MSLSVIQARSESEREKIFQFRYRVYVDELHFSPPGADHERKRLWDPLDDVSVSHALLDGGEVVGSLRVTFLEELPDPEPLIQKFSLQPAIAAFGCSAISTSSRFILDSRLRHGTAILRLMESAYRHGSSCSDVRLNYADCSPHLLPFYEHLGYRRYTRAYNDPAYGFKILMVILLRDRQHFEHLRSPVLRFASHYPDDPEARTWFERTYPEYIGIQEPPFLPDEMLFDLLSSRVATDPLHSRGLLWGLGRAEAEQFLTTATFIRADAGDRIVRYGEPGNAVFMLLSGLADVTLDGAPDRPVAVLGPGDLFGEISSLVSKPCVANVIARAPCEMIVLSAESMNRFMVKEPAIAAKVLSNLSRILAERRRWLEVGRREEMLAGVALSWHVK